MSALCPFPERLPARPSSRSQVDALAPFPAPRLRPAPWGLNREQTLARAYVHQRAITARRRAALDGPPTKPDVANVSVHRIKTSESAEHFSEAASKIIPGPAHLDSIAHTTFAPGQTIGIGYVSIPELGYYRHIDDAFSPSTEENFITPLDIDTPGPVTLIIGYQSLIAGGAPQSITPSIHASVSYSPITTPTPERPLP